MSSVDRALVVAEQRVGTTLRGKWHLDRLLGVGGMAAVYAGRHRNGIRGAVKVLDPMLSRHPESRERFLREGRIANEVRHSGAVRVLDDDETSDGSAFLVMELLEGSTLENVAAAAGGKLPAEQVARYAAQILDTLTHAHRVGVIHRDIKPENLFLTRQGALKIVDFGIAWMKEDADTARLTQSGETIGTPAFMSPEQARGRLELIDARSDLYSLGATMYTLLTGKIVHESAQTAAELLVLAVTRPATRLTSEDAPEELVEIVNRALEFMPSARFATASEMQIALIAAYEKMTGGPLPVTPISETELVPHISVTRRFATTMVPIRRTWKPIAAVASILATTVLAMALFHTPATKATSHVEAIVAAPSPQTTATTETTETPKITAPEAVAVSTAKPATTTHASVTPAATPSAPTTTAMVESTSRRNAIFDRRN